MRVRLLAIPVLLAVAAPPAAAQSPIVPVVTQGPCGSTWNPTGSDGKSAEPLGELTRRYLSGDWASFQVAARDLLMTFTKDTDGTYDKRCTVGAYQFAAQPVQLVWADSDAFGSTILYAALVASPDPTPYSTTLPGVASLRQIFVARQPTHVLASLYVSTPTANPLLEQIPAVAAAVVNPLVAVATQLSGTVGKRVAAAAAPAKPPNVWTTVSIATLPDKRASLEFKAIAAIEPSPAAIARKSRALAEQLRTNDAAHSSCAIAVIAADLTAIENKSSACSEAIRPNSNSTCIAKLEEDLKTAFDTTLQGCKPPSNDEMELIVGVDAGLRKFLTELSATDVTGNAKLANVPLERVSFGLVTGVITYGDVTQPRVKMTDDGRLGSDPLGRQLLMVVVNSSFKPYDSGALTLTEQERWRWFGGAVVSPGFGVGGGLSVLLVRGFGFNVGGAIFSVNALREGDEIGNAPASSSDPFALGWARVAFVGASYNFK
jgi:hypothetical protein